MVKSNSRHAPWTALSSQEERKVAHLAAIARCDTVHGGARALAIASRCSKWDAEAVVFDVYARSTGRHSVHHEAWRCRECGAVHLGVLKADMCCMGGDES